MSDRHLLERRGSALNRRFDKRTDTSTGLVPALREAQNSFSEQTQH